MRFLASLLSLGLLALGQTSFGAFSYHVSLTPSSSIVAAGSSVVVQAFITESGTAGAGQTSIATNGFTGGNFKVSWDAGGSAVSNVINIAGGTGFFASPTLVGNEARIQQFGLIPITGSPSVLLGTFTFTAGNSSGTTNISALEFNSTPGFSDLTLANGQILDGITTYGNASIIVAVPEPTSMTLLGCVAVGGFAYKRWRRKK